MQTTRIYYHHCIDYFCNKGSREKMEALIVIVGFLGAGKTTLLKRLVREYLDKQWNPYIILNDYQNANLDAQQFLDDLNVQQVRPLSGSCICCSGVAELRSQVNSIPRREKAITLIEANGTTDACSLMGFLGVGLAKHFMPPIQISVVDARYWQKRGSHNELEANQIQVSSLIILNRTEEVSRERIKTVEEEILQLNPSAIIKTWDNLDTAVLAQLHPSKNSARPMEHQKSHWSSCSADLPCPFSSKRLRQVIQSLPAGILRVKGSTKLDEDSHYSFFEKTPSGEVSIRPFRGEPTTGPKILVVGPGSDPDTLQRLIAKN